MHYLCNINVYSICVHICTNNSAKNKRDIYKFLFQQQCITRKAKLKTMTGSVFSMQGNVWVRQLRQDLYATKNIVDRVHVFTISYRNEKCRFSKYRCFMNIHCYCDLLGYEIAVTRPVTHLHLTFCCSGQALSYTVQPS